MNISKNDTADGSRNCLSQSSSMESSEITSMVFESSVSDSVTIGGPIKENTNALQENISVLHQSIYNKNNGIVNEMNCHKNAGTLLPGERENEVGESIEIQMEEPREKQQKQNNHKIDQEHDLKCNLEEKKSVQMDEDLDNLKGIKVICDEREDTISKVTISQMKRGFQDMINNLAPELVEQKAHLQHYKQNEEDHLREIESLRIANKEFMHRLEKMKYSQNDLRNIREKLESDLAMKEKKWNTKNRKLRSTLVSLEKSNEALVEQNESLKKELSNIRSQVQETEKQRNSKEKKTVSKVKRQFRNMIHHQEQKLKEQQAHIEQYEQKEECHLRENESLRIANKKLVHQLDGMKHSLKGVSNIRKKLESDLAMKEKTSYSEAQKSRSVIESLDKSNEKLMEQNDSLKKVLSDLRIHIQYSKEETLSKVRREFQDMINVQEQKLKEQEAHIKHCEQKEEDHLREIESLRVANKELTHRLDGMKDSLETLSTIRKRIKSQKHWGRIKSDVVRKEKTSYSEANDKARSGIIGKITAFKKENESLKHEWKRTASKMEGIEKSKDSQPKKSKPRESSFNFEKMNSIITDYDESLNDLWSESSSNRSKWRRPSMR